MADRLDDLNARNDLDSTGRINREASTSDAPLTDRERAIDRSDAPVDGEAVGGVSGLAAGAAIGAVTGGPVGAVIGAAAGALTGVGVAKGVDAAVNPDEEDRFWRENYRNREYAAADHDYEQYRPAYRYGWEAHSSHANRPYDEIEPELERNWDTARGESRLAWSDARHATRDAWDRIATRRRD